MTEPEQNRARKEADRSTMQSIHEFDFVSLNFDKDGNLVQDGGFDTLKQRAGTATDVIFLAHGFRNDVVDATTLYSKFLDTFRGHFARPEFQGLASRNFVVAGVFWPSKALPESFPTGDGTVQSADEDEPLQAALTQKLQSLKEDSPEHSAQLDQAIGLLSQVKDDPAAQDKFSALVLSITDGSELDSTEGLPQIRQQDGSVLFQKLTTPIVLPTEAAGDGGVTSFDTAFDEGDVESIGSFFGSILGGIDKFLNLTTWYVMKNRSGVVGATGVAKAVRDLKASAKNIKIHLVGHSLGGRLMAACSKSLTQDPILQPDSVTLLEAAFSHYGFSDNNGQGTPGFFRDVIDKKVVKGALLETFSMQDTVVGLDYSISSRLADDNVKAIGDANDEFGGIGRNGSQKTAESVVMKLKTAASPGGPYVFQPGIVTNLDGSGLIKDHGDVTNENVTYAFASSVAATTSVGAASP
jgi:hypothetical protein